MKAQSQQRRIEELEAQLQEAEDRVKDLREELSSKQEETKTNNEAEDILKDLQEELIHKQEETMTNGRAKYLEGERTTATVDKASTDNSLNASQAIHPPLESQHNSPGASDMGGLDLNQRIEHPKCNDALAHMSGVQPDLSSIISKSMEHGICRKKRTHRIRDRERNLNAELSRTRQPDVVNSERKIKGDEKDENIHALKDGVYNRYNIEQKEELQEDSTLQSWLQSLRKNDRSGSSRNKRIPSKVDEASHAILNSSKTCAQPEKKPRKVVSDLSESMVDDVPPPKSEKSAEVKRNKSTKDETLSHMTPMRGNEPIALAMSNANDAAVGNSSGPVIKFTFKRRRKRETLTCFDGSVSENATLKRKSGGKQNDSAAQGKSCFG